MNFLLLIFTVLFFASSCSFERIYKENDLSAKVEYLSSIRIIENKVPVKTKKVHRIFYDKLSEELKTDNDDFEYLLYTNLSDSISGAATTSTGSVGRYKYTLSIKYTLIDSKNSKKIDSGFVKSIASYEASNSRFTIYSSEEDMLNKLVDSAIQKLKLKIITSVNKSVNVREL